MMNQENLQEEPAMSAERNAVKTAQPDRIPLGETAAALLSAALGCLMLSTTHRVVTQSQALSTKAVEMESWLDSPALVGSYPINQMVGFSVWFGSWAVLHSFLRRRDLPLKPTMAAFFVLLILATAMAWKPIGSPIGRAIASAILP